MSTTFGEVAEKQRAVVDYICKNSTIKETMRTPTKRSWLKDIFCLSDPLIYDVTLTYKNKDYVVGGGGGFEEWILGMLRLTISGNTKSEAFADYILSVAGNTILDIIKDMPIDSFDHILKKTNNKSKKVNSIKERN